MHKVNAVKSRCGVMLSVLFFLKGFTFGYLKQIVGDEPGVLGFWGSDMLILSMDEGKYLSLLELPLLFLAELSQSAGAEPMESCASVPAWRLRAITRLQQLVSANTTSF